MIEISEIIVEILIGFVVVVLGALIKPLRNLILFPLKYPIIMEYCSQYETKKGYVFVVNIRSKKNNVISIMRDRFYPKLSFDKKLIKEDIKQKLTYGEHIDVFESQIVLNAFIDNRSFGNVTEYISCTPKPKKLFLIIQVKGPGTSNPSARFQLGKVYKSIKIKLRKRLISLAYLEIPINHITFIAGNDKTRIIEK